jgi:anti-sigma-K factor RskA
MSEIHGAVGSYVVNALDASELEEFEAHLAVCPTCSREVVEFGETAAELSRLATAAAPPPELRSSILSAISGVRVLPPLEDLEEQPSAPPALVEADAPTTERAPIDELALRRQQRRARILTAAVAAVMVVALSLGGWVFTLVRDQQSQVADQALETQLFSAPDVEVFSSTMKNGAKMSFVVSKGLNKAMFVSDNLPATGTDKTYQLWTLNDAGAVPDNLVAGGGSRKEWFKGDVAGSSGLAVSIEAAGGAQQPTDIQGTATI